WPYSARCRSSTSSPTCGSPPSTGPSTRSRTSRRRSRSSGRRNIPPGTAGRAGTAVTARERSRGARKTTAGPAGPARSPGPPTPPADDRAGPGTSAPGTGRSAAGEKNRLRARRGVPAAPDRTPCHGNSGARQGVFARTGRRQHRDGDGSVNFEQRGVEFPDFWSVNAVNIVTSKYFRGAVGTPQRETSLKQLIDRIVKTYRKAGEDHKYFASPADAEIFEHELAYALLH